MITAKVTCTSKDEVGEGDDRRASVSFTADYDAGRNQEWAYYTPALSLSMTLRGDVADRFEPGQAFTLSFDPAAD